MLNGQMEGVILKFRVKEGSLVGNRTPHLAFERRSAGEPCITLVELGSVALAMLTVWVDSRCRRVAMERDTHHVEEWCGGG